MVPVINRGPEERSAQNELAASKTLALDKKVVNRRDSLEHDSAGIMQVGLLSFPSSVRPRTIEESVRPRNCGGETHSSHRHATLCSARASLDVVCSFTPSLR